MADEKCEKCGVLLTEENKCGCGDPVCEKCCDCEDECDCDSGCGGGCGCGCGN